MDHLTTLRRLLPLSLLLLALPATAQETATQAPSGKPLLALDLPLDGGLGATAAATYEVLRAAGEHEVWWLKVFEPPHQGRTIAACAATGAALNTREVPNLLEYVRGGGGLVLLVDTAPQWRRTNSGLLTGLDVQLAEAKGQGDEISVRNHPVTEGLGEVTVRPPGLALQSGSLDPLVTRGGEPLALAGVVGRGRVVVLLSALVAATDPNRAPEQFRVQLLARALKWAAVRFEGLAGAGSVSGPGTPLATAPVAATLARRAVSDLPADDRYKPIGAALGEALAAAALPAEPLNYRKDTATLAAALAGRPALLVVSSYREYDLAETAAAAEYVFGGGSLLVLPYAQDATVKQLANLNRLLGEFGIAVTYGRPAGEAQVREHPVTEGLSGFTRVPAGSAVWAYAQWPLVTVGEAAVASAHLVGNGRVIVLDGSLLVRPADSKAADSSTPAARLLQAAIRWLTGA